MVESTHDFFVVYADSRDAPAVTPTTISGKAGKQKRKFGTSETYDCRDVSLADRSTVYTSITHTLETVSKHVVTNSHSCIPVLRGE